MNSVVTFGTWRADAREGEMDQNLDDVTNMVGNLRNMAMAIDMGNEVTVQNQRLDLLSQKVYKCSYNIPPYFECESS